jgi:hypothetical protein
MKILTKLKIQNYVERCEIHMHTRMHINTRTLIHIDMYICINTYVYTYACTYIYIYIYVSGLMGGGEGFPPVSHHPRLSRSSAATALKLGFRILDNV